MPTVRLVGVNTVRKRLADGSVKLHYYHRAIKTKLSGEPESTEFITRLNELNAQMTRPATPRTVPGTISALIEQL